MEKMIQQIGKTALKSVLYEVACFPSPGLVSPISNGAHKDMTFYTFIDSAVALSNYFTLFAEQGMSDLTPKELFHKVRQIGIQAEKEMFEATKGINTHKGLLFLMAISCSAVASALHHNKPFSHVKQIVMQMSEGLVEKDFKELTLHNCKTHGEMMYVKYGIKGVRGEVQSGLSSVFDHALEVYKNLSTLSYNDRMVHTLLVIMTCCEDSTVVYRHDVNVLKDVQQLAIDALDLGGMTTAEGRAYVQKLDLLFIERNISPGGCADLLAMTLFFEQIETIFKMRTNNTGG